MLQMGEVTEGPKGLCKISNFAIFLQTKKCPKIKGYSKKILEKFLTCLNNFFHSSSWQYKSKHTAGHIFRFVSMCVSHAPTDSTNRHIQLSPPPQNVFQTAQQQSARRCHFMDGDFTHLFLDSSLMHRPASNTTSSKKGMQKTCSSFYCSSKILNLEIVT